MRIAIFTESYLPVVNGVSTAVSTLAQALGGRHDVTIYAPRYPGYGDAGDLSIRRFPSYPAPGYPDYPLALPFRAGLLSEFRRERFDVIHTHSPFTLGQVGRFLAKRLRIPLVTTYHTLYVEYVHYGRYIPPALARSVLIDLTRRYCNAADVVTVPTEPIRAVLEGYGVTRPIVPAPTGTSFDAPVEIDPRFPRRELGIAPEARIVLYAGRLAREKNLPLLFEAFRRVAVAEPTAHLLIAGGGPAEAEAHATVPRLGLTGRVTFAGFIPRERLRYCYADAAVFAFSSLTDTQGLVLIEAKAAGVPVVSVAAYGPATVVRHGVDGLLVPNDPAPFADAVLRILRDADLRASLSRGARADAERFGTARMLDTFERIYQQALAAGPEGTPAPALPRG
jgi:glycosyltransferase involved in cell wall biosynthesis